MLQFWNFDKAEPALKAHYVGVLTPDWVIVVPQGCELEFEALKLSMRPSEILSLCCIGNASAYFGRTLPLVEGSSQDQSTLCVGFEHIQNKS